VKWITAFLALEPVKDIPRATMRGLALYAALVVVFVVLERFLGKNIGHYRNRSVINDFVYCIFFNGGYFTLTVWPLLKLTQHMLAPFRLNILPRMPLPAAVIVFYIIIDFSFYWAHRLMHTKYFWPFHTVHHSQEQLTVLTTARFHILDVAVFTIVTAIPAIILGFPLPVAILPWIMLVLDKVQHANVDWTYGPLYSFVVSPRYHRIHHAVDPKVHNRNFGRLFTCWDHIFGTVADSKEEPQRFGVDGLQMPETLTAQFIMPFSMLIDRIRRTDEPASQPASQEAGISVG